MNQKTGIAATISILAAIGSYIAVCSGHGVPGFFLSLLAVILGIFGLLMAASPRVGGGLLSILSILLGVIGVGFSLLVGIFHVIRM